MDRHDVEKQQKCRDLLQKLNHEHTAIISTQVIQEFYVTATKKLNADPFVVKKILQTLKNLEIVVITPALIEKAIDIQIENKLSFWDSLIIAAAEHSRCEALWTEDLNQGQIIRDIQIINPLK